MIDFIDDVPVPDVEIPPVHTLRTILEWRKDLWYRWYLDDDTNEILAFVLLNPQPESPRI